MRASRAKGERGEENFLWMEAVEIKAVVKRG